MPHGTRPVSSHTASDVSIGLSINDIEDPDLIGAAQEIDSSSDPNVGKGWGDNDTLLSYGELNDAYQAGTISSEQFDKLYGAIQGDYSQKEIDARSTSLSEEELTQEQPEGSDPIPSGV